MVKLLAIRQSHGFTIMPGCHGRHLVGKYGGIRSFSSNTIRLNYLQKFQQSPNQTSFSEMLHSFTIHGKDYERESELFKILASLPSYSFTIPKTIVENNQRLIINLKLFKLLHEDNNNKSLKFILKNLHYDLNHELIEFFIYKNIGNYFITPLLQKIFHSYPTFKLSNEVWSMYLSTVTETFSFEGAKLVYHNIIDNKSLYQGSEYSELNSQQTIFPYLINPNSLEQLCYIYTKHDQPDYIDGLIKYFKRFYSIDSYKDIFQTLSISSIETYSKLGNFGKALRGFNDLSNHYRYPLDDNASNLKKNQVLIKSNNWRINNLMVNQFPKPDYNLKSDLDKLQIQLLSEINKEIYNPIDDKYPIDANVPIYPGNLLIGDLPVFQQLINEKVKMMLGLRPLKYVELIQQNHFNLTNFIVSELTSYYHFLDALVVMCSIPRKTSKKLQIIFTEELFLNILIHFKKYINHCKQRKHSEPIAKFLSLEDVYNVLPIFLNIYKNFKNGNYNQQSAHILTGYVSIIINHPKFESRLIDEIIDNNEINITLSPNQYRKLKSKYNLNTSKLKVVIRNKPWHINKNKRKERHR